MHKKSSPTKMKAAHGAHNNDTPSMCQQIINWHHCYCSILLLHGCASHFRTVTAIDSTFSRFQCLIFWQEIACRRLTAISFEMRIVKIDDTTPLHCKAIKFALFLCFYGIQRISANGFVCTYSYI